MTLAFICGCAGTVLTAEERAFIGRSQPWGLILFKRNVADPDQLRALTGTFRGLVGRNDAPVLIDQEGGRVQRMDRPTGRPIRPPRVSRRSGMPVGRSTRRGFRRG